MSAPPLAFLGEKHAHAADAQHAEKDVLLPESAEAPPADDSFAEKFLGEKITHPSPLGILKAKEAWRSC